MPLPHQRSLLLRQTPGIQPGFRPGRPRLLVVGCGDIGMRFLQLSAPSLSPRRKGLKCLVLSSSPQKCHLLRAMGITPLLGNLDHPATLKRLRGLASWVLHLAPPPGQGVQDARTRHLVQALRRGTAWQSTRRFIYGSTTGVYGDAQGRWLDETAPLRAHTDRARRRVHAEQTLRQWARQTANLAERLESPPPLKLSLLRIPGIYALDRAGGDPRERVQRGNPVLHSDVDVWTNHIHAHDLARACLLALMRPLSPAALNICDDTQLKMGDYYDRVATLFNLPPPLRLDRTQAQACLSPMQWSFMQESRRMVNQRMKKSLRLRLKYPTIEEGLRA
jgi:nucleoside-diphosphate-sugar epimerase